MLKFLSERVAARLPVLIRPGKRFLSPFDKQGEFPYLCALLSNKLKCP